MVSDVHQQLSTTVPHKLPTITFKQETIEGIKKLLNIMRFADEKDLGKFSFACPLMTHALLYHLLFDDSSYHNTPDLMIYPLPPT